MAGKQVIIAIVDASNVYLSKTTIYIRWFLQQKLRCILLYITTFHIVLNTMSGYAPGRVMFSQTQFPIKSAVGRGGWGGFAPYYKLLSPNGHLSLYTDVRVIQ